MTDYITDEAHGENWPLLLGDSCERLSEIDTDSVDAQRRVPGALRLHHPRTAARHQTRTTRLHPCPTVDYIQGHARVHGDDRLSRRSDPGIRVGGNQMSAPSWPSDVVPEWYPTHDRQPDILLPRGVFDRYGPSGEVIETPTDIVEQLQAVTNA